MYQSLPSFFLYVCHFVGMVNNNRLHFIIKNLSQKQCQQQPRVRRKSRDRKRGKQEQEKAILPHHHHHCYSLLQTHVYHHIIHHPLLVERSHLHCHQMRKREKVRSLLCIICCLSTPSLNAYVCHVLNTAPPSQSSLSSIPAKASSSSSAPPSSTYPPTQALANSRSSTSTNSSSSISHHHHLLSQIKTPSPTTVAAMSSSSSSSSRTGPTSSFPPSPLYQVGDFVQLRQTANLEEIEMFYRRYGRPVMS